MKHSIRYLIPVFISVCFACSKSPIPETVEENVTYLNNTIGIAFDHSLVGDDISPDLDLRLVNDKGNEYYNHLIVERKNNHPVFSGEQALRFEVRPGDCVYNDDYNDCQNDRTRAEVFVRNRITYEPGMTIKYKYKLYIPRHSYFSPSGPNPYSPVTIVTQIYYDDKGIEGDQKGQIYLVMDHDQNLVLRTHTPFTYDIKEHTFLTSNPFDRWIDVELILNYGDGDNGQLTVIIDGSTKYNRPYDFIPEYYVIPQYFFKVGIYNAFISQALQPYNRQVIYFDELQRFVTN